MMASYERVGKQEQERILLHPDTGRPHRNETQDVPHLPLVPVSHSQTLHPPLVSQCSSLSSINISGSNNTSLMGTFTGNTFHFNIVSDATVQSDTQPKALYDSAQAAADSCEEVIKSHYKTTSSCVKMVPWIDDDTKHIMDMYTNLLLEIGSRGFTTKNKNRKKLESYLDIFDLKTREGDTIRLAVLNGLAGRGKSTLVDKMAYDWAVGIVLALRRYKLVLVLKLHALEQSSDLIEAVFDQLIPRHTSIDRRALDTFISNNSDKVLILMDGFDELITHPTLCETSFGSVLKILNRTKYRECHVIVTTRPSHYDRLVTKSLVQQPFAHIVVSGFADGDIIRYVNKFYSDERDKAKGLLERIQSSDVLSELAKSPMLLLLMCLLWRQDSTLTETMSRLYSEAVTYMFKRKDVPGDDMSKILFEIGNIALRGLLSPGQLLLESNLNKRVVDMAIKAGLLTRERVIKGLEVHNSVQFIHMTFQEFCAAKYLQSLLEADVEGFHKTLEQIVSNDPCAFEYLLRFCSGDNEACTNNILKVLQERCSYGESLRKLALNCYFEGQSKNLPTKKFILSIVTNEIYIYYWDSDSLNSFTSFLKHVKDQTKQRGYAYLDNVQKVQIVRCNLQRFGAGLADCMRAMTNLVTLTLMDCSLTADSVTCIVSTLSGATNLAKLDMSDNILLSGCAESWCPHLQHMKHLRVLQLAGCKLQTKDLKWLLVNVGHMEKLGNCVVRFDDVPLVEQTNAGILLDLSKCSFTGTDLAHILLAMGNRSDLVELILGEMRTLSGSSELWSYNLKHLKHLQKLEISCCSLTVEDVERVLKSVSDLQDLVDLNLSLNKSLGGSAALWSRALNGLKQLRKLTLDDCNLVRSDLKYLASSISCMGNLANCDVVSCRYMTTEFNTRHFVAQTDSGIKLDLCNFSIAGEDLADILEAMSNRSDLVEMDLSENGTLRDSAPVWSPQLRKLAHLQKLNLSHCSLTGKDMKHIAVSLVDLPNLVELNLCRNPKLGSSLSVWSPHVQNLKCQQINLVDCCIREEDSCCACL